MSKEYIMLYQRFLNGAQLQIKGGKRLFVFPHIVRGHPTIDYTMLVDDTDWISSPFKKLYCLLSIYGIFK